MRNRFANLKVAHKLLLGFGLVFLLMVGVLMVDGFIRIQQEKSMKRLVEQLYPSQTTIIHIVALTHVIDDDGAWYILENQPQKQAIYLHRYYEDSVQLTTLLSQAQHLGQSPLQQQAIRNFDSLYFGSHGYYEGNEKAFVLKRSGKIQEAYDAYVNASFEPAVLTTNPYQHIVNQEIAQTISGEHNENQFVVVLVLIAGFLVFLLFLNIAWLIVRSITVPLKQVQLAIQQVSSDDIAELSQGLQALAQGDLTYIVRSKSPFPTYEAYDEIGQTTASVCSIITNIHKMVASYEYARQELQALYQQLQTQNVAVLEANRRLLSLAETDPLTSLGNHRAYQVALHRTAEQAYNRGEVTMLALVDLDEFKILNEEYGHLYGDQLLSSLAHLLGEHLPFAASFRLSGDTFAVLVPTSEQINFYAHAEEFRAQVEKQLGGPTVSIGISTSVIGEQQAEVVQEHAYAALHEAKMHGRNLIVNFEAIRERVKLLSLHKIHVFRRLLSERKIAIAFQPIWNLETGTILAFEALARPDAIYGFAGPSEAFELAEQLGRGYDLDEMCILAVLQRVSELPPEAFLFLNITPQTFIHDRFDAETLKSWVLQAGVTPDRVVIEITERASIAMDQLLHAVEQLRQQGFLLALDDTGAGNAGLEMLHQVSVDFVKVDRMVIVNALTRRSARGVLNGICAIAREADSQVIIEGIEDKTMLDLCYELGVEGAQGYLLGRPNEQVPPAEILANYNPLLVIGKRLAS